MMQYRLLAALSVAVVISYQILFEFLFNCDALCSPGCLVRTCGHVSPKYTKITDFTKYGLWDLYKIQDIKFGFLTWFLLIDFLNCEKKQFVRKYFGVRVYFVQ